MKDSSLTINETLQEEGRIFQDGTGSVASVNNMHLPFGPEKRNLMESGSFVAVSNKIPSRFPVLTGILLPLFYHFSYNWV